MRLGIFISLVFLLSSCSRKELSLTWDIDAALPLAGVSIGISDLLPDSMLSENSDKSLNLVFNRQLTLDSFDQILTVPDTLNEVSVNLQRLILDERTLEDTVRLREIFPQAVLLNGQTVELPSLDIPNAGQGQVIDVSEAFFKTATFRKGTIEISIFNDLPVKAEVLKFRLKNQDDGAIILEDEFRDIDPQSSQTKQYDLKGKRVNGVMVGEIPQVKTAASDGPVLVEANKGVRLKLRVFDLEPESATAIFPAQTLVADSQEVTYNLGGAKVTSMQLIKGTIVMDVISTIEEEIVLDYSIPDSREGQSGGTAIRKIYRVPPAPRGGVSMIQERFPIDGFFVVFKGKDQNAEPYYNTVFSILSARIEYSGIERSISLTDSVRVRFGLIDVEPYYATGEFGGRSVTTTGKTDISMLKNLQGGINLEDIRLKIGVLNTFGLEAGVDIRHFTGVNTRSGKSVKLSGTPIQSQVLVNKAFNRPPLIPGNDSFIFTRQNSNLKQFVENLPDELHYDLKAVTSPRGTINLNDFIFSNSSLKANVELQVPINIRLDSLVYSQQTRLSTQDAEQLSKAESGTLKLILENGFPFSLGLGLQFKDDQGNVLYEILQVERHQVPAAATDANGRVTVPRSAEFSVPLSRSDLLKIKESTHVQWSGFAHTPDAIRHKLYENYRAVFKLLFEGRYEAEI